MARLTYITEPPLLFRFDQAMVDPRDGLSLFGPLDKGKPHGIRWGVIGLPESIERFERWITKIQRPIEDARLDYRGNALPPDLARPVFPGFEAVFGIPWAPAPSHRISVDSSHLFKAAHLDDAHQRVFQTVKLFADPIAESKRTEDVRPDLWCVVIPEYVSQNCRPLSVITSEERVIADAGMSASRARDLRVTASLWEEENTLAEPYRYELNFHHQLKARLLLHDAPTQIVRESTIAHRDFLDSRGNPTRRLDGMQTAIAWSLSSAAFYKAGGRPWKLGAGRPGVCYVGLVFRRDEKDVNPKTACCAAQMFLDSGDGVVFKGAVGPWFTGRRGHFHLTRTAAKHVVDICINSYKAKSPTGEPPRELFIHGRVRFDDEEWAGFLDGAGSATNVVGVRIVEDREIKLYRKHAHPALRGMFYPTSNFGGSLWTRGFVPRLRTYPGREVPNPLFIDVCRGSADLQTVARDVLALTKLNYNACQYADGVPVTLKFARAVGEILTAGPMGTDPPPLPFKYYI